MPAYASLVPPDDRWAIVWHLKALQRAQNASAEDLAASLKNYTVIDPENQEERR